MRKILTIILIAVVSCIIGVITSIVVTQLKENKKEKVNIPEQISENVRYLEDKQLPKPNPTSQVLGHR